MSVTSLKYLAYPITVKYEVYSAYGVEEVEVNNNNNNNNNNNKQYTQAEKLQQIGQI
jgi:hypothetical protein